MDEITEKQEHKKESGVWVILKRIIAVALCLDLLLLCVIETLIMIRLWPSDAAVQTQSTQLPQNETPDPEQAVQDSSDNNVEQFELAAQINGTDLLFSCLVTNQGSEQITLQRYTIQEYQNGIRTGEPTEIPFRNFLGDIILQPGESQTLVDGYPLNDAQALGLDKREYVFTFSDAAGNETTKIFLFTINYNDEGSDQVDYSGDTGKDLSMLRYDADFEEEVYQNSFWVPARALGESSYTNAEIAAMLHGTPQQKQEEIDTLYEAIQLYQIGNFYSSDDNINMIDGNGVSWEHHKPGFDAVRTNTGCCASSANWLSYILAGDYDEVGYIAYFTPDGGHIFNYIKDQGFYYVVDMTHYRTDWPETPVESGNPNDIAAFDPVLSCIHKFPELSDFVAFIQGAGFDAPEYIYQYQADNCLAINAVRTPAGTDFLIEQVDGVTVCTLYDVDDDGINVSFGPGPDNRPDYGADPDFQF